MIARPLTKRERLELAWRGRFGPLPRPDRWTFIVGCYNSGTTLLHELLAAHPDVGSMPFEGQFYTDQLRLPKAEGLERLWALRPERFRLTESDGQEIDVRRLKRQWGARFDDPHRPVLVEKTPTNAGRTRWLQKHFRYAHFIGLIRNGYAVAEGIRRKAGHGLGLAARQWAVSNEIMLSDFPSLRAGLLIRYEDLTSAPDQEMARIAEFLNLDASNFSSLDRQWSIFERHSRIRNMNPRSIASLSAEERAEIETEAGYMLERLGYTPLPTSVPR